MGLKTKKRYVRKSLKEISDWEADMNPESIKSENLDVVYKFKHFCKFTSCRRNCKANPLCLSGLGESQWLVETQESDRSFEDPNQECREPGTHVGLQNLGATCYVNSLLQLWFHTPKFRRAIFSWDPLEDPLEQSNPTVLDYKVYHPTTEIGHLQVLFALMCYSKRSHLDPSEFIESLGLDTSTQQDAQEFSKLFVSLLELQLKNQSLPYVQNLISDNFRGEYSYITRCSKCKTESVSPSMFYELELNIKGHKTLDESLSEFLVEEKLEGADRYSCAVCSDKQEAARFISLKTLPPILNFQLLRFVYDRHKGYKKKLNTALQFPEVLDMKKYLKNSKPTDQLQYYLTAVLSHRGTSANSGHYIAYIRDSNSGVWYTFNDQTVEKSEGKRLKLNLEDVEDGPKKNGTSSRLPKGFLASTKAYMLVYTRGVEGQETVKGNNAIDEPVLSERLKTYVRRHNDKFDTWIDEAIRMRTCCVESGNEFRQQITSLIMSLPIEETTDWSSVEAVTTEWLCHWLKNCSSKTDPIDNSKVTCPHGSLGPDHVSNVKYISKDAADKLFEKYGGGPRLQGDSICCRECVALRCRLINLKNKLMDDYKEVTNLLKIKIEDGEPGFWVDKESLKTWKAKVDLENIVFDQADQIIKYVTSNEIEKLKSYVDSSSDSVESSQSDLVTRSSNKVQTEQKMGSQKKTGTELNSKLVKNSRAEEDSVHLRDVSVVLSDIVNGIKGNGEHPEVNGIDEQMMNANGVSPVRISTPVKPISSVSPASRKRRIHCLRTFRRRLHLEGDENVQKHCHEEESYIGNSVNDNCFQSNVTCLNGFINKYELHTFQKMDNVLGNIKFGFDNLLGNKVDNNTLVVKNDSIENIKKDLNTLSSVYNEMKKDFLSFVKDNFKDRRCNCDTMCNNLETFNKVSHIEDNCAVNSRTAVNSDLVSVRESRTRSSNSAHVDNGVKCKSIEKTNDIAVSIKTEQPKIKCEMKSIKSECDMEPSAGADQNSNCAVQPATATDSNCSLVDHKREEDDAKKNLSPDGAEDDEDDEDEAFNEAIVCSHGNLSIDESTRRLVSVKVWEILRKYFPTCRSFPHDIVPCQQCTSLASEDEVVKDQYRKQALNQKEQLKDLFFSRNRPEQLNLPGTFYALPKEDFLLPWKHFIRKPEVHTSLICIMTSVLMCQHEKLIFCPKNDAEKLSLVTENEWTTLNNYYAAEKPIIVKKGADGDMETDPEICTPCLEDRLEAEDKAQLNYETATVFVQRVQTIDVPITRNDVNEPKNKKVKISPSAVRRSSRRRKVRGEKAIQVSCTLSLLDFKLLVMNAFEVAPFDQYLVSEEGRELTDNGSTLRQLEIYPDSTIFLKVDEPTGMEEDSCAEEFAKKREPEAGFKGTKLIT